ncbi:prolyl oligopeptidase family serine peptidase [Nguyenibacter vanlangensis]|uniref:Prolyl oligopeptidase family serine peptidase n=1 Tax=Nguyenibacter vanlangensis TaxID=1216886 RepID=A0ABZ3D5I6_9PROT
MNMIRGILACAALLAAWPVRAAMPAHFSTPAYLSDVTGAQALAWVRQQNRRTDDTLARDPRYRAFHDAVLQVEQDRHRIPEPSFMAGKIFNFWQDAANPRGIWRQTDLASFLGGRPAWITRLDVDALARQEHRDWVFQGAECLEPGDSPCLVRLSDAGEDAASLREFLPLSGQFVPEGFVLPRSKQTAVWEDRDTLLVARDWGADRGGVTASGYPFVVRRLRRGQALDQAAEVMRGTPGDVSVEPLALADGQGRRIVLIRRAVTFFEDRYGVVTPQGVRMLDLPSRMDLHGFAGGRLILSVNQDWTPRGGTRIAAGSVVAVDPAGQAAAQILFVPNPRQAVDEVAVTGAGVVMTVLDSVRGQAWIFRRAGGDGGAWRGVRLAMPDMMSIHIVDADRESGRAFLSVSGFLTPSQLWLVDCVGGSARKIMELPPQFDAAGLEVGQSWAVSADGTRIPYFLVHRRGMKPDGTNPTLLTAYGGFQVASVPDYNPVVGRLWLERGGVYAVANIRGGGEFGPAWHEAGRTVHRQRVFDDFAAVARDLMARGVTTPARLAIRGRSNGGLLMGVEFTQHPELWGAVIIGVPLLDMEHFETMAAGASWVGEYGSMDEPAQRAFLQRISPLRALRAGVRYPEPFIFTSTRDDRVGPVHARRFAAKLQALGVPFLYYEDVEGGHSGTVNAREIAHERALEAVYLSRLMAPAGQ